MFLSRLAKIAPVGSRPSIIYPAAALGSPRLLRPLQYSTAPEQPSSGTPQHQTDWLGVAACIIAFGVFIVNPLTAYARHQSNKRIEYD